MATKRIARPCRTLLSSDIHATHLPRSLLQCRVRSRQSQRKGIHTLPDFQHREHFEQFGISRQVARSNGEQETRRLMSGPGFSMAWREYQSMLLHELNVLAADDPSASNQDLKTIARRFARDPAKAQLFNYASQAHNNDFFFRTFSPEPQPLSAFPELSRTLMRDFRGRDALRALMVQSAMGMFAPGYVWLVWVQGPRGTVAGQGCWRVLTTYSAGTPYTLLRGEADAGGGRGRQQGVDMNNQPNRMVAGKFGNHSELSKEDAGRQLGGPKEVSPVLCVSTWPHVYLRDFSVSGKARFLEAWWDNVDWSLVAKNMPASAAFDGREYAREELIYDNAIDE